MAFAPPLKVLRGIISELRHVSEKPLDKSLVLPYIMNQYRKYQVTDEKLCLGQDEVNYLAQTYLCYLSSVRQHKELYAEYHGKGERSIEESANLVGLRLPKQYEEKEKEKDK